MYFRKFLKILTAAIFSVALIFSTNIFAQQYKGLPVTKERLITALRTKALQSRQIVQTINNNGVDFQVTPPIESELVAAGARPEVLSAVRNNYRAVATSKSTGNGNSSTSTGNSSGNSPITKAGLIKTVKTKSMSNGALIDAIETNGVNFETTPAIEKELAIAGASPAIIAAAKSAYQGTASGNTSGGNAPSVSKNVVASAGYDDLISQAIETYNRDVNSNMPPNSPGRLQAIQTLNKAITIDAKNPIGYQQLGFMTLYGTLNGFTAAENNFKQAIALGGSAVFRVFHDHNGTFTNYCQGSLYVSQDGVRFESDDNKHTFDTIDANIKQVKTNNSLLRMIQIKSGSYKIVLKNESDKDSKNYNFAPLTGNIEESKMVVRLIGK